MSAEETRLYSSIPSHCRLLRGFTPCGANERFQSRSGSRDLNTDISGLAKSLISPPDVALLLHVRRWWDVLYVPVMLMTSHSLYLVQFYTTAFPLS